LSKDKVRLGYEILYLGLIKFKAHPSLGGYRFLLSCLFENSIYEQVVTILHGLELLIDATPGPAGSITLQDFQEWLTLKKFVPVASSLACVSAAYSSVRDLWHASGKDPLFCGAEISYKTFDNNLCGLVTEVLLFLCIDKPCSALSVPCVQTRLLLLR